MDKARSFEYVRRLPESNRDQLSFKEKVSDKQILLNEEWASFAWRCGRDSAIAMEEHTKWITETWEEWEVRKKLQKMRLEDNENACTAQQRLSEKEKRRKEENSTLIIQRLMDFQSQIDNSRTKCRHCLFVDFHVYQDEKFRIERELLELEELFFRSFVEESEYCCFFMLDCAKRWSHSINSLAYQEREAAEESERQRILKEEKELEEERLRLEQQRKLESEEADRQRREQAELEKRLERKRREEMRRAKSRADRLAQQQEVESSHEPVEEKNLKANVEEKNEVVSPEIEDLPGDPSEQLCQEAEEPQFSLNNQKIFFSNLEGDNIVSLFASATAILSSGGDSSYVMSIKRHCSSTVVCENGISNADESEELRLLGKTIASESCVSVSSTILHENVGKDIEHYLKHSIEKIADVQKDDRCIVFCPGTEKKEETLVLFPVRISNFNYSPFIVAISRSGCDSFSEEELEQAGKLVFDLSRRIGIIYRRASTHQLCQQCVEWISLCLDCENVYLSLEETPGSLTYVAATHSHRFLLGMTHSREEEEAGEGISFKSMDLSIAQQKSVVSSYPDVSKITNESKYPQKVRFFRDSERKGPLLIASITGCRENLGVSLGCLFVDGIGSTRKFSSVDEDAVEMATQLLADIMLGSVSLDTSITLQIEKEVSSFSFTFLKILWKRCLENLASITPNQLLELGKYLHPPPLIPKVVQATLLIALRSRPSKIAEWDSARKKVNAKLLEKMLTCDPTNSRKIKNGFFTHARRAVKGLTIDEVFEKGSYPTQCFYKWVFAALLLRRQSSGLRKQLKKGGIEFEDNLSVISYETASEETFGEEECVGESDNESEEENEEDCDATEN